MRYEYKTIWPLDVIFGDIEERITVGNGGLGFCEPFGSSGNKISAV
jgi:hypothetical protein